MGTIETVVRGSLGVASLACVLTKNYEFASTILTLEGVFEVLAFDYRRYQDAINQRNKGATNIDCLHPRDYI